MTQSPAIALVLLLSGCGSFLAAEDYCEQWASTTCGNAEACGCYETTSMAEFCRGFMRGDCQAELDEELANPRLSWDGGAAANCLAEIDAIIGDCSVSGDEWAESCESLYVGSQGDGEACEWDEECQAGLECGPEGACGTPPGSGDSCSADGFFCVDDLYCSATSATCEALPGVGESCADDYSYCDGDTYCDLDDICQAQGVAGASCGENQECISWDCDESVCAEDLGDDSICDF